jgi:hypothetical protein
LRKKISQLFREHKSTFSGDKYGFKSISTARRAEPEARPTIKLFPTPTACSANGFGSPFLKTTTNAFPLISGIEETPFFGNFEKSGEENSFNEFGFASVCKAAGARDGSLTTGNLHQRPFDFHLPYLQLMLAYVFSDFPLRPMRRCLFRNRHHRHLYNSQIQGSLHGIQFSCPQDNLHSANPSSIPTKNPSFFSESKLDSTIPGVSHNEKNPQGMQNQSMLFTYYNFQHIRKGNKRNKIPFFKSERSHASSTIFLYHIKLALNHQVPSASFMMESSGKKSGRSQLTSVSGKKDCIQYFQMMNSKIQIFFFALYKPLQFWLFFTCVLTRLERESDAACDSDLLA